ncbi:MAG: Ig domain-containing protein [Lachnospiraceae bacterium]|nr:Ig domain-containing protein [Lachnospiraceae bacterium]
MRKVLAIFLAVLMVAFVLPLTADAASENVTFTVAADKSTVERGDTVNFTVSIGAVQSLGVLQFKLIIPDGMTIVDDSISLPDGLATTLDSDGNIMAPSATNSYRWGYSAQLTGYSGTTDLVLVSFACTVDEDSAYEQKNVTIEMMEIYDNINYDAHTTNIVPAKVTVMKTPVPVTGVSLDKSTITLKDGETATLTASVTPSDADNNGVTWSSSNTAVATVTNGTVTAVKEGTAVITVTTVDGGKTATCAITVTCNHSMTKTAAVAATCGKDGNIEYYTCSKCERKYSDETGTTVVTDVVTKATGNHVNTEIKNAVAATEEAEGYTGDTYCKDCGVKLATGEVINKLDHTHTMDKTAAVTPTCVKDGNVEYYTCTKCNKVYADENGVTELKSTVVLATGHTAGTKWVADDENHWKECIVCAEKLEVEAHTFKKVIDKEATEDETGLYHEECSCGKAINENTEIPKLDHVHVGIVYVAGVEASCQKEGTVEYWTCASDKCAGKYYGDSECQVEIEDITVAIDPDKHMDADCVWTSDADKHVKTCKCGKIVVEGEHEYDNMEDAFCNLCDYQKFYQVVEGDESKFELESGKDVTIKIDGEFELFEMVKVDGEVVDPVHYTVSKGSTVITFTAAYLETLSKGTHTIDVYYSDGKVANTEVTIVEKTVAPPSVAPTIAPTPAVEESPAISPKTGSENNMGFWICLIVIAGGAGVTLYSRKRKDMQMR